MRYGRQALTDGEKAVICDVFLRREDRGKQCDRQDLIDEFNEFVSNLPIARQNQLPFRDLTPGKAYIKGVEERNARTAFDKDVLARRSKIA